MRLVLGLLRICEIARGFRKLPEDSGNCQRVLEIAKGFWKLPEDSGNCQRIQEIARGTLAVWEKLTGGLCEVGVGTLEGFGTPGQNNRGSQWFLNFVNSIYKIQNRFARASVGCGKALAIWEKLTGGSVGWCWDS